MSGIHHMLFTGGAAGAPVSDLTGTVGALGSPPQIGTVQYVTNGTITGAGYTAGPTNWFSPTTVGIGNSYWIRFTLQSGVAWDAGLVSGTIYALSSNRSVTWTCNTAIAKNAVVDVVIYSDSGGVTTVGSGSVDVSVDASL